MDSWTNKGQTLCIFTCLVFVKWNEPLYKSLLDAPGHYCWRFSLPLFLPIPTHHEPVTSSWCCWCNQNIYWIKHERTCYDDLLAVGLSFLVLINAESHQIKAHHKETIRLSAANITILPSKVNVTVDLCQISKPSMWGTTQSSINQFSPKELWTWMIINYFWLEIPI